MNSTSNSVSSAVDASRASVSHAAAPMKQGPNHMASPALGALGGSLQSVRERAGPALRGLADGAQDLAHVGALAVGRRGRQARDTSTEWVRERPLRAVLVAAGAGAAVALLAGWIMRFNGRAR